MCPSGGSRVDRLLWLVVAYYRPYIAASTHLYLIPSNINITFLTYLPLYIKLWHILNMDYRIFINKVYKATRCLVAISADYNVITVHLS